LFDETLAILHKSNS